MSYIVSGLVWLLDVLVVMSVFHWSQFWQSDAVKQCTGSQRSILHQVWHLLNPWQAAYHHISKLDQESVSTNRYMCVCYFSCTVHAQASTLSVALTLKCMTIINFDSLVNADLNIVIAEFPNVSTWSSVVSVPLWKYNVIASIFAF